MACGGPLTVLPGSPDPVSPAHVQYDVLIMPLGQKTKEERGYWTSESQRLVLSYFDIFLRHGFDLKTSSRVTVAEEDFEATGLQVEFKNIEEDRGSEWWSFVPVSGQVVHGGRTPDYVLIFDGLRFRIQSGGGARQTYDTPGGGRVEVDLEYILWDNRNQEIAAHGRLHEEAQTSSPHASSMLFKNLFEKMAEDLVRETLLTS
jgi:hypothetical protein